MNAQRFIVADWQGESLLLDTGSRTPEVIARLTCDETHKPQAIADALNAADLTAYDAGEPF